jgi:hypothetical protein
MKKSYLFLSIFLAFCLCMAFPFDITGFLVPSVEAETTILETGWENGQIHGLSNRVEYSKDVAGYYNTSSPPPECSRRYHETVRSGNYALMIAGYSQASYSYCYYRVFDQNIPVQEGLKIGYWIYHAVGSPKVSVDGHFTDGSTIRDFYNNGYIMDQYDVRIHPAARMKDPMKEWYYVEVDLSKAAGKTIDFIMFAFDNGNDGFTGQYRAYVDDFRVFNASGPSSITGGLPKGAFGSGGQTDEVTEPLDWRWSEWFYGHRGIDQITWQYDACGGWHNYAIGWHQNDLIEYLMKFGGQQYSRLVLRGIADCPGPVELAIYIDGQYRVFAAWDNNNDCNQDVAVDIPGIPYDTHAIAVKFVNDHYNPPEDRNFYLDGLLVERAPPPPPPNNGAQFFGLSPTANDVIPQSERNDYAELGITDLRVHLQHGKSFSDYDDVINYCNDAGIKVMMLVSYESYASNPEQKGAPWDKEQKINYYYDYNDLLAVLAQAVPHFKALGVKDWEIWNEENGVWHIESDLYAQFLCDVYKSFKYKEQWDPEATICFGGLDAVCGGWGWNTYAKQYVEEVHNSDAFRDFKIQYGHMPYDAMGIHPYNAVNDQHDLFNESIEQVCLSTMRAHGSGDLPIWITELGDNNPDDGVNARRLEDNVRRAFAHPSIKKLHWFKYTYPGSDGLAYYSLVMEDGHHRESYYRYCDLISELKSQ